MTDGKPSRREARRGAIVEKLARHVARAGLGDTGLRRLAEVAGTSDRMLLYYFDDKDELLAAVLGRIASDSADTLEAILGAKPVPPARALETIWKTLQHAAFADQLRLWLDLSGRASRGDPGFVAIVDRIRDDWVARLSALLDVPGPRRTPLATLMMAAIDGQVVLFPTDPSRGGPAIRQLVRLLERHP